MGSEYMKVNGVRVNTRKYYRRLRIIDRQVGRRVLIRERHSSMQHRATILKVPPTGRQVYPTLAYRTDCGIKVLP